MKNNFLPLLLCSFFLIAFTPVSWAQYSIHLKEGNKYEVSTKVESDTKMEMMGESMDMTSTQNIHSFFEVLEESGNNYVLNSRIDRLQFKADQMGQEQKYDSENKEDQEGMFGEIFKDFVKKDTEIEIDKKAKIVNLDFDTNIKQEDLVEMAESGFGVVKAFFPLPDDLSKTENWTRKVSEAGNDGKATYTVKSMEDDIVHIEGKGNFEVNKTIEQGGMEIKTKGDGTLKEKLEVNKNTGIVHKRETTTEIEAVSDVMEQEMPFTAKTTEITTVKEL